MAEAKITVELTKRQWLAMMVVFDIGKRVADALGLIQNTMSAEQGANAVRRAVSEAK